MQVDLDGRIPPALYRAVAELLAWLYRIESGQSRIAHRASQPSQSVSSEKHNSRKLVCKMERGANTFAHMTFNTNFGIEDLGPYQVYSRREIIALLRNIGESNQLVRMIITAGRSLSSPRF